ncbi:MAG: hypothetical protein U5Q44_11885 [Dehalococcoidia bacterium]|nr:hypothetical protein [Dehalococcoidia bacterium]
MWPQMRRDMLAYITAGAALIWGVLSLFYIGNDVKASPDCSRSMTCAPTFFRLLGAGIVFVTALLSARRIPSRARVLGEYYGLLLVASIGMVGMAAARELLTAYISLGILSFSCTSSSATSAAMWSAPRPASSTYSSAPSRAPCCSTASASSTASPAPPTMTRSPPPSRAWTAIPAAPWSWA